jgi:hypothetical protein
MNLMNLQYTYVEFEFEFIYNPQIQLQVDTIGYGTSQVQIHNICTIIVLLEKSIKL